MSERVYQQKMLDSKSKVIMCNWERGSGKTYAMVKKLLPTKGEVLFLIKGSISNHISVIGNIIQFEMEDMKRDMEKIKIDNRSIQIKLKGEEKATKILFANIDSVEHLAHMNFDYIVFNEYIPNEKEISNPIYYTNKVKQVLIIGTFDGLEYINDESDKVIDCKIDDMSKFIETQIKELMLEFSNMPKRENTVKTRNDILKQITELTIIKDRLGLKK